MTTFQCAVVSEAERKNERKDDGQKLVPAEVITQSFPVTEIHQTKLAQSSLSLWTGSLVLEVFLVTPIFRKGDANDTANYRPIAVG